MERISSFERIVGDISEPEAGDVLHGFDTTFQDQSFEKIRDIEREKTSEELEIISLADKATNDIRRRYGLEDFSIPAKNIHIIPHDKWPDKKGGVFYVPQLQGVVMEEMPERIVTLTKTVHEMLHFKSYNALQKTAGEESRVEIYRAGLTVHSRDGNTIYFSTLNEAITEELTKECVVKLSSHDILRDEMDVSRKVIREHSNAVTESGDPLFDNDTYYAAAKEKREDGRTPIVTKAFGYSRERRVLRTLVTKIYEKNKGGFKDTEEVFQVFARGMITGDILPLGRVIEKTFGKGTFRRIGELDNDVNAQYEFVASL